MSDTPIVIIGGRRSGRTTKLVEATINWLAENEGRALLVCCSGENAATYLRRALDGLVDVDVVGIDRAEWDAIGHRYGFVGFDDVSLAPAGAVARSIAALRGPFPVTFALVLTIDGGAL